MQNTKRKRGNFNYTERPFGYLIGTKVAKPFSTPGKPGSEVVRLCHPCHNIKEGNCRFFIGDLNNRFSYGKDCAFRGENETKAVDKHRK
jgi:hypothetical protein